MRRENAIKLVRQLEEAVNAHDVARLSQFYAEEAVMVSPVFSGLAGRAAIEETWKKTFALFPDWKVRISDVLVDGDRIALIGTARATDRHGWFGEPATGERIEYRAVIVLTLLDGRITRDERVYDLTGILERLEKARLEKELRMAAEVQRALLSGTKHRSECFVALGESIPCRAMGGDFFELADLPSGELVIALGDVFGKGPPAAILAAMIQGILSAELHYETSPAAVLAAINRQLVSRQLGARFATLVYGVLSTSGRFVYSKAGHNAPFLLNADAARRLEAGGPVLGVFAEASFPEEVVWLKPGETILVFSDGVVEARDASDREFGEDRLLQCAEEFRRAPIEKLLHAVFARVRAYSAGQAQADDLTLAVARFSAARRGDTTSKDVAR